MNYLQIEEIIKQALIEDIGTGDITTLCTIPESSKSKGYLIMKEEGVVAGIDVASLVFGLTANSYYSADELLFTPMISDGELANAGQTIAMVEGSTRVILTAERTALNIVQHMCGIATRTAKFVKMVNHTKAKIIDTRKTIPGLRMLEKYAVRMGGGQNHRYGLYDAVLIKDNHIEACGGVTQAVQAAKSGIPHTIKIEVEADTLDQVEEALNAGAEMILLDNMTPDLLTRAVELCRGRAITEASGGVTEENLVAIAESGVDLISIGALTHSVKALDIGLDLKMI